MANCQAKPPAPPREASSPSCYSTDRILFSRGVILTVAERARAPIIGSRYGLPWYFGLRVYPATSCHCWIGSTIGPGGLEPMVVGEETLLTNIVIG